MILSGEYAVVFGNKGLAVPAAEHVTVIFKEDEAALLPKHPYIQKIIRLCEEQSGKEFRGDLTVESDLPIGKGMGSSTALVIAMARCLLGEDCRTAALEIEDAVNPGHSGLDFAVIWENQPVVFKKGEPPKPITLPKDLLKNTELIDTGKPEETTPELIAWIKSRQDELAEPLRIIGECTERILGGEDLKTVMRDHHKAQVALGVVPKDVQELIAKIEQEGGSAKVIGAGGRTGGGGMVLAIRAK
jgi:mevalonate kinase